MYSMVVMLALSQSPALEQVRPDEARYGNQLVSQHNRLLGGRRNRGCCNTGCGYSSGCNTCAAPCTTGCGTAVATTGCADGSCGSAPCATASCGTSCGMSCDPCCSNGYGSSGRRGLFGRRGGRFGGGGSNCCQPTCVASYGYAPMVVNGRSASYGVPVQPMAQPLQQQPATIEAPKPPQ